jgi:hypothetical protein
MNGAIADARSGPAAGGYAGRGDQRATGAGHFLQLLIPRLVPSLSADDRYWGLSARKPKLPLRRQAKETRMVDAEPNKRFPLGRTQ